MESFLIENSLLQDLNKKDRALLDANESELRIKICKYLDILSSNSSEMRRDVKWFLDLFDSEKSESLSWYLDRIYHYQNQISAEQPVGYGLLETISVTQARFQYTFWFEAMVWYIRTEFVKKSASDKVNESTKE